MSSLNVRFVSPVWYPVHHRLHLWLRVRRHTIPLAGKFWTDNGAGARRSTFLRAVR